MNPVAAISAYARAGQVQQLPGQQTANKATGDQEGFAKLVKELVQKTNADQIASDDVVKDLVAGKTNDIQQVVLTVASAEMSFQLFMEIRNKLIDSYNELMHMQF